MLAGDLCSRMGFDCFKLGMVSGFDLETDCREMSGFQFSISLYVLFPAPVVLTSGLCLTLFPLKVFDAFRLVGALALVDTFAHGLTSSC